VDAGFWSSALSDAGGESKIGRVTDPTPSYGITGRLRKAVGLSAERLSRAINGLTVHHADEPNAVSAAAFEALPLPDAARLARIASDLRAARSEVLERLAALRDPLLDLVAEAHGLLPASAQRSPYVDPDPQMPAPTPLAGLDLEPNEKLRVLLLNLNWTQDMSRWLALEAFGSSSTLAPLIEHPTQEATALRESLDEALVKLREFILRRP
jgi:hypothetical protein